MHTFNPALSPIHMQATIPEIDLSPSQGAEFSRSQAMSIGEQDSGSSSHANHRNTPFNPIKAAMTIRAVCSSTPRLCLLVAMTILPSCCRG